MDPRLNPYAPGAGTPPPELAGRNQIIEKASIALDRMRSGRAARSVIFYGLRGVGKLALQAWGLVVILSVVVQGMMN